MSIHLTPSDIKRFWSKVDGSGGDDACWEWQRGRSPRGYGKFTICHSGKEIDLRAHRVAYCLTHNVGLDLINIVRHSCDNPPCCNGKHLLDGTNKDNTLDAVERGRMPRGERHGRAILTEADVRYIRRIGFTGEPTVKEMAIHYGVSHHTILHVIRGLIWKWLPDDISLPPSVG